MNLLDKSQIPGYAEAREKEQSNRDLAFLDLPIPLCGVVVRQFCLKHLILLGNCENAFLKTGAEPKPEDVAQFIWIVSPEYSLDPKARGKFVKKLGPVKYVSAVREIEAYLTRAFQDAPCGNSIDKQYTADCAWIVEVMASEYGWDDDAILLKPIARLFQYLRLIQRRNNPKAILFNPSDRVLANHMRASLPTQGEN